MKRHSLLEGALVLCSIVIISLSVYISIEHQKPSYDYLSSVTVEIYGVATDVSEESDIRYIIEGENLNCARWMGTGVIIKESEMYTYILTNAHVAGKGQIDVKLGVQNGDSVTEAKIIKYSEDVDLAVISVKGHIKDKRAILGYSNINPQDKVYLVGHHLGRRYLYGEGVCAGYDGDSLVIQIPTLFGDSGSGIFNQDGLLVGVVFAASVTPMGRFPVVDTSHGLAVKIENVRKFIDEYVY